MSNQLNNPETERMLDKAREETPLPIAVDNMVVTVRYMGKPESFRKVLSTNVTESEVDDFMSELAAVLHKYRQ